MKIFAYAVRKYDELHYFEQLVERYHFTFGYTSDYPCLENAELAKGYDAISIITNRMDPELLDKFHGLGVKYIATRSIGYDHIDLDYAHKLGMRVSHVTYSPDSVANYTIMMMLMACRKMPYIMEKARFQDFGLEGKMGKEFSLCKVGIIGTGKIGETVIRHLQGFGCEILAYDLYQKEGLRQYATYVDLDTLYRESDIISLHVPGMASNYHIIGRETFGQMKDGVILVNAARGMLVDTEALVEALESGKVGFAALDTFEAETGLYYLNLEKEILSNRDRAILSAFPNVLLSPHMAFYTDQAVSDMVENAVIGLLNFEKGGPNPLEAL